MKHYFINVHFSPIRQKILDWCSTIDSNDENFFIIYDLHSHPCFIKISGEENYVYFKLKFNVESFAEYDESMLKHKYSNEKSRHNI